MHLLLSVSMLPSLQEITPLPLSRVYSPLIVPPFIADSLQWLSIGPWAGPHLLLSRSPFSGFYPPMCPIIAERLQRYASSALANFHGPYLPQIFRTKTKSFWCPQFYTCCRCPGKMSGLSVQRKCQQSLLGFLECEVDGLAKPKLALGHWVKPRSPGGCVAGLDPVPPPVTLGNKPSTQF